MGMYSYLQYEDLHSEYPEELVKWRERKLEEGDDYWDAIEVDENGYISFEGLSGFKIISYWYPEFIQFLTEIALFIRGQVCFLYETSEEMATIHFEDGTFYIDMGEMCFTKFTATEVENIHGIDVKIPEELKDLVMVGSL